MKSYALLFLIIILSSFVGCSNSSYVLERMYLGRNIGSTGIVSDSSWTIFKREIITPNFPQGFTVTDGEGQWKDSTGVIIKEPTFILEIIHSTEDTYAYKSVIQIIEEYKTQFHQEAVLHLIIPANVEF